MAEAWITCSTGGPRVHVRRQTGRRAARTEHTLCGRIVVNDIGLRVKVSCFACSRKLAARAKTAKPTAATLDLQRFAVFEGGHLREHSRNGKQGDSLFFTPATRSMCGAPLGAILADARGVKLCPKCLKKT